MPNPTNDIDLLDNQGQYDWNERLHYYLYLAKILLRKYWWIIGLTTALGVGYQARQAMISKPVFSSNARLMLSGFVANPVASSGIQEQFSYWFGNQVFLLRSTDVTKAAHDRVRAFQPTLERAHVGISAQQIPDTAIIQISAWGDSREYTQAYLNALVDEYMNIRQQMKGETSERALLAIAERLDDLERQIREQEDALVEFRKNNNLIYIQEQGTAAGSNLARLRDRRADIRTQIRLLETLSIDLQLQTRELLGMETAMFDATAEINFRETKRQADQLRAQISEFSVYLKPRHPRIIQLNTDLERTLNLLEIYKNQALDQVHDRRLQLRTQLENLDIVISEQEQVALSNSRLLAEFERINANLSRSRNLYENLLRSIQNLETGQQIDTEIISILDRASPPAESRASLTRKVGEGFAGGLFAGVFILGMIGFFDSRVFSGDDLKRRFDDAVLGVIPLEAQSERGRVQLLHAKDKRHLFAEACRTLRSSIFFMGNDSSRPRLILVTSSVPGEGKSTIASNLAVAMAMTSARTLLVDGDLRRGHLAQTLDLNVKPGLSDLLQRGQRMESVIQKTAIDNLDFIAAGDYPDRPGELLLSMRMDELMDEFRNAYDYVVIDTAPILATDDTTGFCAKADSVLFVVRSAFTQARQIRTAVERLKQRGAPVAGFVLNCVDTKGTDYYYYKKYNDYYAYSPRS
jgi:polysaccharide biosynthesis transport protein